MSTSTPNFHFTKPAASDNVNVADLNGNFDIIDSGVEPVHATQTVTGSAGSVTITNPLDAPVLDFTATGIGAPSVFYVPGMSASAQGQQDWDTPLVLDVPIGISTSGAPVLLDYGGGVGSNSYKPTAGTEAGTTIWWNSAQLAKLFDEAEDAGDEGTYESGGTTLFTWTLPFSVAENSVVYCSHLKNQNVSGEEGIWASGNHMYLRIYTSHLSRNDFSDLAILMRTFANKVNYYDPFTPKGTDPENWLDFWIMATPAASYTKESDKKVFSLSSGSQMFLYSKISDYVAMMMGQQPSPTPLTNVSVTYLTNVAANITQNAVMENAISAARQETAALGEGASANTGGAIGTKAKETNGGGAVGAASTASSGAAIGARATEINGGAAVGFYASSTSAGAAVGLYAEEISGGGAVGYRTKAAGGGAVGYQASETSGGGAVGSGASATSGGAIGRQAQAGAGFAAGDNAICKSGNTYIDAIQLGTGTNSTAGSMQVYSTPLLIPDGNGGLVIPPALLIASVGAMTAQEKTDFKTALGIS